MREKLKALYILGGVFTVLITSVVLLLVFTNAIDDDTKTPDSDIKVYSVDIENITSVKIANESGEYEIINSDGRYLIKGREDVAVYEH